MTDDILKAPVPKFASFRPRVVAEEVPSRGDSKVKSRDETERAQAHRGGKQRHYEDERSRSRHRQGRSVREHTRKEKRSDVEASGQINPRLKEPVVPDVELLSKELRENESSLYRIDLKGDNDNLQYRSLHKYSIPRFKRTGYGRVLGASIDEKIDRLTSDEKGVVLIAPNLGDRSSRRILQRPRSTEARKLHLIRPGADVNITDHCESFIALKLTRKRKRGSQSPDTKHGERDFRSVQGDTKATEEPEDSDLEYRSDSSEQGKVDNETDKVERLRNAELSRRTRDNPQDLEAWLLLIEHQQNVLGFASGELSTSKSRTLADIRISIYEQALRQVKAPGSRATLSLGLLEEGAKLWEAKQLASKWQETLRTFNTNLKIWTTYLDFIQSSYAEFRYERCKSEYQNCLAILAGALAGAEGTSKADEISTVLVYVFLRLTVFMRDAGYHELAEALWQAILELHFFEPHEIQEKAATFESFWDSEVPRIGEEGANGWAAFSPEKQEYMDPVTIETDRVDSIRDVFVKFARAERSAAQKLAHPGRSADDASEDDPYHIVLSNDINPVLFPHLQTLPSKSDLEAGFLRYLTLPPLPWASTRAHETWWLDPYLANQTDEGSLKHLQITTDLLFSDAFDVIDLPAPEWTRNALRSLIDASPSDEVLAEYFIAYEFHLFKSNASKSAKRLLKTRSSSMRLYNCYAIIECRTKGLEAGSRIFATAISMSISFDNQQKRYIVLLIRTWIWEALRNDEQQKAVNILLSVGKTSNLSQAVHQDKEFSPANLLRVRRWLTDGRDGMFTAGELHLATLHSELLALLAYLQHGTSLEAALIIHNETSLLFSSRNLSTSPAHEHLHQAKAQLMAYHLSTVHIYKPSVLRNNLAESIRLFPNNTILLGAYSNLENTFSIEDRIHSPLTGMLMSPTATIIHHAFALHALLQRSAEFGGTSHSVRACFERALAGSGKHCLALWMHYLDFEFGQDNSKAKTVFLRGLRELPWCKWWVIRGLDLLAGEEGRRVWDVLVERELRVIVDIEDLVEDMGRARLQ